MRLGLFKKSSFEVPLVEEQIEEIDANQDSEPLIAGDPDPKKQCVLF